MNLTYYIFEKSKGLANKIAIFHRDKTLSYSNLYSLILKVINEINSLDIKEHEKIIIVADNSIFFIVAYFAIIGSGCVAVPIHPDFGKENFNHVYKTCEVRYAFIQKKYWKRINTYNISFERVYSDLDLEGTENIFNIKEEIREVKDVDDRSDVAVIIFTSGSTDVPKGVMLSHYNIMYNTNSIIEYLELTESDRVMVVLPFSYCFGTSLLHTHLRVGGQVVINNLFMFPAKVLREINDKNCTVFAGVPSTFSILLRRSPLKKMKFPSLRLIQQAGGKLTNALILELKKALPTTKICIMYGQTEATARLSYLPPELLDSKLGSIGRGIPGTKIEVLNKNGDLVKPREIGEIVASGGNIMLGYWQDPEETAKVLKDGKLFTGDLGFNDEEGYIFLTDRAKEIIKVGGYRVGPKEIENIISKHPDVVEVAIIGIYDELLGEAIKAFVSLTNNSNLSTKELISYCQQNLPSYKVPKSIEIMASLPKNISNKIDKVILRNWKKKNKQISF
ncbi:MAG: class I adenylate-forming enzyme family protein [Promethearchaeota archaeon]